MAWVEMYVEVPKHLDNPDSIKGLDNEITKKLVVCSYCPPPCYLPVKQVDSTWALRILFDKGSDNFKWLKSFLEEMGFKIIKTETIS